MALDKSKNASLITEIRAQLGEDGSEFDSVWDATITIYRTTRATVEQKNTAYVFKEDVGYYNVYNRHGQDDSSTFYEYIILGTVPTIKDESSVYSEYTGE